MRLLSFSARCVQKSAIFSTLPVALLAAAL
jgi:hypothetical protein